MGMVIKQFIIHLIKHFVIFVLITTNKYLILLFLVSYYYFIVIFQLIINLIKNFIIFVLITTIIIF